MFIPWIFDARFSCFQKPYIFKISNRIIPNTHKYTYLVIHTHTYFKKVQQMPKQNKMHTTDSNLGVEVNKCQQQKQDAQCRLNFRFLGPRMPFQKRKCARPAHLLACRSKNARMTKHGPPAQVSDVCHSFKMYPEWSGMVPGAPQTL